LALGLALLLALMWWLNASRVESAKLPDFSIINEIPELKIRFFEFLEPLDKAANQDIQDDRNWLLELKAELSQDKQPGWIKQRSLNQIARQYGLEYEKSAPGELVKQLLQRVDTIPVSLILVQAAAESGWGRSRFARRGNNLFGEWCYTKGCGLVPKNRPAGDTHEVRVFDRPYDSVTSYLHTLNTHPAYKRLRQKRQALRNAGQTVTGRALAGTLVYYSERRQAYVNEIKTMLHQYNQMMDDDDS
jgi:Bax protein